MEYNTKDLYIDSTLSYNLGKLVDIHMQYLDEVKEFKGVLEKVFKDHLIISDHTTGKWTILPLFYLNHIVFEEEIDFPK